MPILNDVKNYIVEKFATDLTAEELPSDLDLLATGILTSITTVQLLGWCGRTYQIPINSISINPDDLKTPEGIACFIEANRSNVVAS
ncbi:acyl carrier protein [Arthrobacter silvisoli]|uniref:acyl carrier protein n=1 Tax=Arthrobacter silvisoli TaxID=2291022 RepID=UPI000E217032|nr:acyl carrier protein [Arthrobacter silvisoli]